MTGRVVPLQISQVGRKSNARTVPVRPGVWVRQYNQDVFPPGQGVEVAIGYITAVQGALGA